MWTEQLSPGKNYRSVNSSFRLARRCSRARIVTWGNKKRTPDTAINAMIVRGNDKSIYCLREIVIL